jgi:trigger factor
VEIKPKIELRDYKAPNPLSLKPDKRTIGEEQVTRALDVLREQHAQLHPAPAGTALAEGDFAILDVEGFLDLAPLEGAKKEGQLHKIGSKTPVLGLEVDSCLVGKKEGDFVEISQPYPASHPDERLAGKSVVFRVSIKGVKQKKLPPLDDEFAKDCGPYSSLVELRGKLTNELESALKKDIDDTYKDTVLKRLLETHHFEVPDTLVERELATMLRQQFEQIIREKGRASGLEDPTKRQEEIRRLREELRPEGVRRVKAGLILEAIAERERITVGKEDLEGEIQRLASEAKVPVQEVRRVIESGGEEALEDLQGRILADKALEFVYRHAVIQG